MKTTRWARELSRLEAGHRPDKSGWSEIVREAPDHVLREAADRVRQSKHRGGRVGYIVDRNVNYTNACSAECTFCAFHRREGSEDVYVLSFDDIFRKVDETIRAGGSGILFQGGLNPRIPLSWHLELLSKLKSTFKAYLHCYSPPEIWHLSQISGTSPREVLARLRDAGLDSMPGGGAEILVESVRARRTRKCTVPQWIAVTKEAHRLDIVTTATMVLGLGESWSDRLDHLEEIRRIQAETAGIAAFIPWTFQAGNTILGQEIRQPIGETEYLRWLATSRLYLDNVPHVQVSRVTQGLAVASQGLTWGANDIGSVMMEENVVRAAGAHHDITEPSLIRAIQEAGFVPCTRNGGFVPLVDYEKGLLVSPSTLPAGPRPVIG